MKKASVEALVVCLVLGLVNCEAAYTSTTETICPFKDFKPSCPPGYVIIISSALYGRMRVGKCISSDERPDCTSDVRGDLDRLCSGRTSCHVTVPHPDLHRRLSCGDTMLSYLEVTYDCTPVVTANENCDKAARQLQVNQTSGHLSSVMVTQRGWGSKRCPWLISATPGRGVQLTLIDFGGVTKLSTIQSTATSDTQLLSPTRDSLSLGGALASATAGGGGKGKGSSSSLTHHEQPLPSCRIYATVRERVSQKPPTEMHICSTGSRDGVTSFSTTSSVVEVTLHVAAPSHASDTSTPQFLLRFEETGCADLQPPSADSHVLRSGSGQKSTTRIKCNLNSFESELVCEGTEWKGEIKNCSIPDVSLSLKADNKPSKLSVGVAISVLLGLVVGATFGVVSLGLVILWNRHKRRQKLEKNLRNSLATSGQVFQLGFEGGLEDSVLVMAPESQPFMDVCDSNGLPFNNLRICRNNSDAGIMALRRCDSRHPFNYPAESNIVFSSSPLPRSLSLGRNIMSNQISAGIGPGTMPRVAMTPANQNACLHCQTMAANINRPLYRGLDLTSDLGHPTLRNTDILKTHGNDDVTDGKTSDWREANENQYS